MKIFCTTHRHILTMCAYVLLTAALFVVGYAIGVNNGNGIMVNHTAPNVTETPQDETPEPSGRDFTGYRVIIEDDEIRLYSDIDGVSKLISNEPISESAFPQEDIDSLRNGMTFENIDEALSLMENFLS